MKEHKGYLVKDGFYMEGPNTGKPVKKMKEEFKNHTEPEGSGSSYTNKDSPKSSGSFNLSEKIIPKHLIPLKDDGAVYVEDVKEFIRLLKKNIPNERFDISEDDWSDVHNEINKLAGEKLT